MKPPDRRFHLYERTHMETVQNETLTIKQQLVKELLAKAALGIDVRDADPRETSIEAVVTANKIFRAQGRRALANE